MAVPTLTPSSTTSAITLTVTGNVDNVNSLSNPLPFGIYTSNDFKQGAKDQVAYTYKKLGGDVLDIELTQYQVYAAYEESVLEYSYIVNLHQAKNVLSNVLGNTTGSFDNDGVLKSDDGNDHPRVTSGIQTKFPKVRFEYARRVSDGAAGAGGFGGYDTIYSASFSTSDETQQDYDLQAIISSNATSDATLLFSDDNLGNTNKIKNKKIMVRKIYYKTPQAMWRFFGYYGGLNTVGNLANYGQYADDTTWELIPAWQNKLQAAAFEDAIYTRMSHFSYELKNNKLRIFPAGSRFPKKYWVEFTVQNDAWYEDSDRTVGVDGINNMNTLPFENIAYENINSMGKQWIRRFALAIAKEMLGQIRGKFGAIPIPGESLTLNADALLTQGKEEQDKLREDLKTTLDELTYAKLAETDATIVDSTGKVMQSAPVPIFVG